MISIRTETCATIDSLGLLEGAVLCLRVLACSTRSSKWEKVLSGPEWGLTREQATQLSNALLTDITGKPVSSIHLIVGISTDLDKAIKQAGT
jgi:hypothetical protein